MLSVIIPSKTDSYLDRCLNSLIRHGDGTELIVVVDSGLSPAMTVEWEAKGVRFVTTRLPFVFAQAINDGVALASRLRPHDNLLLLNDDCEIQTPHFSDEIEKIFYNLDYMALGVLGLRIQGGCGNDDQRNILESVEVQYTNRTVCFIAVAIPRTAWQKVGPMDERFTGYGYDDDSLCREATLKGFRLALTGKVTVQHGFPPYPHSSTFMRDHQDIWSEMYERNRKLFAEKYGPDAWNPVTGAVHEEEKDP